MAAATSLRTSHRLSLSSNIKSLFLCTQSEINATNATNNTKSTTTKKPEKISDTICYMMSRRPWTTRLQNSIRNLIPNSTFTPDLLSDVINSSRHPNHALQFFRFLDRNTDFSPNQTNYHDIISLLTRNAMLNHARCILFDDIPPALRTEQMFASLIDGYGRNRIPQEAVKVFQKIPEFGITRGVVSYDALFKAILRSGRVAMAKRVFNSMVRDGVEPGVSTYNVLIWGFCLSEKIETAKRFFGDMKEKGKKPDVVTFNTMISGFVRVKDLEGVKRVFDEMVGCGLAANSVTYNLLIKGYAANGMVDEALKLFGEMVGNENGELRVSEKTFAAIMPGLCDNAERSVDARRVFDKMVEKRFTPKDKSVFLRLVSMLCESGDLEGALEVHGKVGQLKHVTVDPAQYGLLIERLCEGGKYDGAVAMLDELIEKGILSNPQVPALEASAYNPMIEYLCGNDGTEKAETFFRLLMKKGVDDKVAFNNLIRGYAKEGLPESAANVLNIMTRQGVETEADSYVLLIESFLKKGEPADAKTALDSMIEQGHIPTASMFRLLMVALFDAGRVQTASRVMRSMVEKGVKENMDMVHKILDALFVRGHVEEALGRINLLMMNDCSPDIDSLLVSLCDNGKATEAQKLTEFALERDVEVSFSSYDRVMDALSTAGMTLPAYNILCKIKAKGGVVNKKGCDDVIKSLIAEGNTKQADILSRILEGKMPTETKRGKKVPMAA